MDIGRTMPTVYSDGDARGKTGVPQKPEKEKGMNLDKLAKKIAQRDKRAFELLYDQTKGVVFAVCLGVVKNRALAEEIMQETFVTVWTRSAEFRGFGYKTWVLKIAKNKALNALRKNKRETPVDFAENEYLGGGYEIDSDTGIVLKQALERLSADERQIVLMRNAGMQAKEIAKVLEMPRGTVSWKYTEALKKLKALLKEWE